MTFVLPSQIGKTPPKPVASKTTSFILPSQQPGNQTPIKPKQTLSQQLKSAYAYDVAGAKTVGQAVPALGSGALMYAKSLFSGLTGRDEFGLSQQQQDKINQAALTKQKLPIAKRGDTITVPTVRQTYQNVGYETAKQTVHTAPLMALTALSGGAASELLLPTLTDTVGTKLAQMGASKLVAGRVVSTLANMLGQGTAFGVQGAATAPDGQRIKAGLTGAAQGLAFGSVSSLETAFKIAADAAIGAGATKLSGGSNADATANAITMGFLASLGFLGGQHQGDIPPEIHDLFLKKSVDEGGVPPSVKGALDVSSIQSELERIKTTGPSARAREANSQNYLETLRAEIDKENQPALLSAGQKPLQLAEKSTTPVVGEGPVRELKGEGVTLKTQDPGFTMTNEADKGLVATSKALSTYQEAVRKYNQNPTPQGLEAITKAREAYKATSEVIPEVKPVAKVQVKPEVPKVEPRPEAKVAVEPSPVEQKTEAATEVKPEKSTTKPSKIGKSIEAKAIEARLTKGFSETAGYEPITIKEQSEQASNFINDNLDQARATVRGEQGLPRGLKATALITAMEEHIKQNPSTDLAYELANSPLIRASSEGAQELRLAAERLQDSATVKLEDLKRSYEQQAAKATKTTSKDLVKQLRSATEKVNLTKEELSWDKFLDEIKC